MLLTFLRLGRVSNLPTVWSNTVAGAVLAGATGFDANWLWLILAMTMAYIGGMFLNDAFDAGIDAIERPERPIPAGMISAQSVFMIGFALLLCSVVLAVLVASRSAGLVQYAGASTAALSVCIVLYNVWHKENPLSPIIMGLCRMLVYISAGFALLPQPSRFLFFGALVTLSYLIGLTYIAKHENKNSRIPPWPVAFLALPVVFGLYESMNNLPTLFFTVLLAAWLLYSIQFIINPEKRNIPKAVVSMIAGISLLDAIYISTLGSTFLALCACACFALTLFFQRYIAGT